MTAWLDAHPGEALLLLVVAYWLTWALAATPALILRPSRGGPEADPDPSNPEHVRLVEQAADQTECPMCGACGCSPAPRRSAMPSAENDAPDCRCPKPTRPTGREAEPLPPWKCLTCGGYACEYADPGKTRCSPSICDCFITMYPDSPRDLHPEAFIVGPIPPEETKP